MKIADIHAHVFPDALAERAAASIGSFYRCEMPFSARMDILKEQHEKAGISCGVISNSAVNAKQVWNLNNFLAQAARENPGYIAFGSVYPGMDGVEEELDRMMELGLRGVKIHPDFQKLPIDEECGIETYRAIARRDLPVLFHMGDDRYDFSSPERLTNLLRRVPELRVIAAHFGGWTAWERSYAHPQPENVLYDTSSTTPLVEREFVLRMLDKFGPERFLFGTDFPMWEPKAMVEQFRSLGLDEATLETVFYGNFRKLLGLPEADNDEK